LKRPDPLFTWMSRSFIAVGVISLIGGGAGAWWRAATEREGVRLPGVVDSIIEQHRTRQGGISADVPIIRTTLPTGEELVFRNMFHIPRGALAKGESVMVVHRAEFPAITYLAGSATSPTFALLVGGGLGMIFIVLGAWAIPALGRVMR
jgi:hypothetical protein